MELRGVRSWGEIAAQASANGWTGEADVTRTDGERMPADCSVSLVQDADQESLAYSIILRDMRERRAFEKRIVAQSRELEKANEDLLALDRLKDNFMTLVSHELRTPLNARVASDLQHIPVSLDHGMDDRDHCLDNLCDVEGFQIEFHPAGLDL